MHSKRLRVVSALPLDGGWRADLALDRTGSPPRAVLVARVPPAVVGDALALSMLARGVDLASRVQHPALRRLIGTGELEGDLVLVEAWREGETLRGVLDAGGPLTPALASRVAIDLAQALHAAHTLPAAQGRPLCHGAVRAERVLLAEDGEVLLCGLGRPFAEDATPEDDLRGLARLLLECLPPVGPEGPGPLAAVLDRVLAGEGYPTAQAFAEAVAAVVTPDQAEAVVARVAASQAEGMPAWLGRRHALEQALREVEAETAAPIAPPPSGAASPPDTPSARPEAQAGTEAPPATSARPRAGLTPDHPPPLPHPAAGPAAAGAEAAPADAFVEVARAAPRPAGAWAVSGRALPLEAWFDHPRAPQVAVAVLGLLGVLLGFALGRR